MGHTAIAELGRRAKSASRVLASASTTTKDAALHAAADLLVDRADDVLAANRSDIERAERGGVTATVVDRLRLTEARVGAMAGGLRNVASLPDPVGEVLDGWVRPNGLRIERVRVPLGVVAIIYENRPNVTSDAFALCLKSGNAAFLRGSSGAIDSNVAIASILRESLVKGGPAGGRRGARGGREPRGCGGVHAAAGVDRLPHPARRSRPHPVDPGQRHRAVRDRR
jgi:glutamate-5-semialdehyde dehydrogenase